MSNSTFRGHLKRGKVTSLTINVAFPDGTSKSFDVDAAGAGGLVFDDGVMKDLVQARIAAGGTHWAEALTLWDDGGAEWQDRASYVVLPKLDFDRCGPGDCTAATTGQCVNGGQCDR